jgi:hypothetical protein
MTEQEWLSGSNPHPMLTFLKGQKETGWAGMLAKMGLKKCKTSRKFQLFACACCRRLWPLLVDESSRRAVEIAELYADGLVSKGEYRRAIQSARAAALELARPRVMVGEWLMAAQSRAVDAVVSTLESADPADEAATWGKEAVRALASRKPHDQSINPFSPESSSPSITPDAAWTAEAKAQCALLRELFGNPFANPKLDEAWRSPQAQALAKSLLQNHTLDDLTELAKLLEQAGCEEEQVLRHCREQKEHVRGCWVMDFVLGTG